MLTNNKYPRRIVFFQSCQIYTQLDYTSAKRQWTNVSWIRNSFGIITHSWHGVIIRRKRLLHGDGNVSSQRGTKLDTTNLWPSKAHVQSNYFKKYFSVVPLHTNEIKIELRQITWKCSFKNLEVKPKKYIAITCRWFMVNMNPMKLSLKKNQLSFTSGPQIVGRNEFDVAQNGFSAYYFQQK